MGDILGIDLGAAYAKAVFIREGEGTLRPVPNDDGAAVFRVCGTQNGFGNITLCTTDRERQEALNRGERVIENVKPLRGRDAVATALETAVLGKVLDAYYRASNTNGPDQLDRIVLSHPVSAGPASLRALKDAAIGAGLPGDRLDTIEEPVAGGLFATRASELFTGRILVIDAGHYTTDYVLVEMDRGRAILRSSHQLGLRLGVGELAHAVGKSVWLKAQLKADIGEPSEKPFDLAGPGSVPDSFVTQLTGLAETKVITARGMDWFNEESYAWFSPGDWLALATHPWVDGQRSSTIEFYYDAAGAQTEELTDWEKLGAESERRVRQLHFQAAIRQSIRAVQATLFSVLCDVGASVPFRVVLGGGLSLLPEMRDAIDSVLRATGADPAIELSHNYPGYGELPMGNLLWVASGAAMAGVRGMEREDELSDTIGLLLAYPRDEGLELLDREGFLPPEGATIDGIIQMPDGEYRLLLHRILARRGTQVPCTIHFPQFIERLTDGPAQIPITRFGDDVPDVGAMTFLDPSAPGIVAHVDFSPSDESERKFRLELVVNRNDDWTIRVVGLDGREVKSAHVSLLLRSDFDGE